MIRRYDAPETLFYLDLPYRGNEEDCGVGTFAPADFERIAEKLAGIAGRFILSINDRPEVRNIFSGFEQKAVQTTYTIGTATSGEKRVGSW